MNFVTVKKCYLANFLKTQVMHTNIKMKIYKILSFITIIMTFGEWGLKHLSMPIDMHTKGTMRYLYF